MSHTGTRSSVPQGLKAEVVEGDILDYDSCRRFADGANVVFHLAGLGLSRFHEGPEVNARGTFNVVASCRAAGVDVLVFLSSVKAAGPSAGPGLSEEDEAHPIDRYGWSKQLAEQCVRAASNDLQTLVLRVPFIYGPEDPHTSSLIRACSLGVLPLVADADMPKQSIVFVDDLVNALVALGLDRKPGSDLLYIAHDSPVGWNQMVEAVAAGLQRPLRGARVSSAALRRSALASSWLLRAVGRGHLFPAERVADIFRHEWVCQTRRARERYGISCLTPLEAGMALTIRDKKPLR
jgi:dihydroflavonol-4-reductase